MAKGFKLPQRTALLVFDAEYEGAEVRVKLDMSIGFLLQLEDMKEAEGLKQNVEVLRLFADNVLLGWNLEGENGQPIPATGEGLQSISPAFARLIIDKWTEVALNPPAPLSIVSGNGSASVGLSIPTGTQLESLGSSRGQN